MFILAIDQGTSSTRAIIFELHPSKPMRVIAQASRPFPQYFPQASWVEHNLDEIWHSVAESCSAAIALAEQAHTKFRSTQIAAIGITNQRETLTVFDRLTSQPLAPAIVWQCKRSSEICRRFSDSERTLITHKTGLQVDPYFSASKLTWWVENQPAIALALRKKSAAVGTIDTYLIHRLSGARRLVTEASNASRTMLYEIERGCWDDELLGLFSVPHQDILPEILDSAGEFARTNGLSFLPDGIPITGVLGDQQAALAGQACFSPGESKCTYGTGAFLLCQLGATPIRSQARLLTTVSWSLAGQRSYALEGSVYSAGAAVQFIRDQLGLLRSSSEASLLDPQLTAAPDLYFVPGLAGLGAPWWEPEIKGGIFGLTRGSTKAQLILATLEGIAFQVCDLITAINRDLPHGISMVRVDGGASSNDRLLAIQADLANLRVERPIMLESTALGAAIFAALGANLISSIDEARGFRQLEAVFTPLQDDNAAAQRLQKLQGWQRALAGVRAFHT